jgi:hypothetical protein
MDPKRRAGGTCSGESEISEIKEALARVPEEAC